MCLSSSSSTRKQEKAPIGSGGSRKRLETARLARGEVNGDGEREREGERNSLSDSNLGTWTFYDFPPFGKTHRLRGIALGTISKTSFTIRRCVCLCVCALYLYVTCLHEQYVATVNQSPHKCKFKFFRCSQVNIKFFRRGKMFVFCQQKTSDLCEGGCLPPQHWTEI